jgi:hypothetical protein
MDNCPRRATRFVLSFQLQEIFRSYLSLANAQFAVSQESTPIDRARRALKSRIAAAATAAHASSLAVP